MMVESSRALVAAPKRPIISFEQIYRHTPAVESVLSGVILLAHAAELVEGRRILVSQLVAVLAVARVEPTQEACE